jgi:hypothetical protein
MVFSNPAATRVILVGTSKCPNDIEHLPALPSVERNVNKLEQIFRDPLIVGLPQKSVVKILNAPGADKLGEAIARAAKEAFDVLILYYAGHGIKAPLSRGLYLTTKNTTEEHCQYNGLSFDIIRSALLESPARIKILIVDSCFSGEITEDEMGTAEALLSSNIELRGTYAIASSPANRKSIAPTGAAYTAFSGTLIEVLEKGIETGPGELSIDDIYRQVERNILQQPNLPKPQRKVLLDADQVKIARNQWITPTSQESPEKRHFTSRDTAKEEKPFPEMFDEVFGSKKPKSTISDTELSKSSKNSVAKYLSFAFKPNSVLIVGLILDAVTLLLILSSGGNVLGGLSANIGTLFLLSPVWYFVLLVVAYGAIRHKDRKGFLTNNGIEPVSLVGVSLSLLAAWVVVMAIMVMYASQLTRLGS